MSVDLTETPEGGAVFLVRVTPVPDETGEWVIGCRADGTRFHQKIPGRAGP